MIGFLLGWREIKNSRHYIFFGFVFITWISIKPSNFVFFVVAFCVFSCGIVVFPRLRRKFTKSFKRYGAALAVVAFLVSWVSFVNWNQSKQEFQYQLDYRTVAALTVLSEQNFQSSVTLDELKKTHQFNCAELAIPGSMVANFQKFGGNCQEDKEWLSDNFSKWYAKFLLFHPEVVGKLFFFGILAGNSPFGFYSGSVSILPQSISSMFFGERNYALRLSENTQTEFSIESVVLISPIIAWILIFIILQMRAISLSSIRVASESRDPYGLILSLVLFILSILGLMTLTIFSPTEWFRQTIQFQVLLFISTLILLSQAVESKIKSYSLS